MGKAILTGGQPLGAGKWDVSLGDPTLRDLLATYKRRVAGLYRPLAASDIPSLPAGPLWASRKIDGELWFLVAGSDGTFLASPGGRAMTGALPVLTQADGLAAGTIVAGELHVAGPARERVGDLAALRAGGEKADTATLVFTAFDLVQDGERDMRGVSYEARNEALRGMLPAGAANLRLAERTPVASHAELQQLFKDVVEEGGAEGLVVRTPAGMTYKIKPAIDLDVAIVAFTEKVDEPGHVRSILVGLMHEDGSMQLLGGCGNVGTMPQRKALFERLAPRKVASQVRHASDSGALYQFVAPEVVVTITVTDLQGERSDGTPATMPLLAHGDQGWMGLGVRPCPRPIHPVLDRIREDKSPTAHDIRFAQVASWVAAGAAGPAGPLPESTLLRREVWTKETKGQVAVRKLVIWQTNKEAVDPAFPAYVVHWTDYSAARGTPLEREVRLAPTEKMAMQLGDAMVAENIKKGWLKA